MIEEFGEYTLITTPRNSVVVQKGSYDHAFGLQGAFAAENDHFDHVRWGIMDNMPNVMKKLISVNHLVPALLVALRDLTFGAGIGFFKREIRDNKLELIPYLDNRIEDWSYETELDEYLTKALNQYYEMGNAFAKLIYDPIKDWYGLDTTDCFSTRIAVPVGNKIEKYAVNPYFGDFTFSHNTKETDYINAFDFKNPLKNKRNVVSMMHIKDHVPGNHFYSYPTWWCAKEWIELSNLIPIFHKNGIKNGYNIKYLIKMPKDYFDKEGNKQLDDKAITAKWAAWSANLSKWLAGETNVNKTMLIKYMRDTQGKAADSVIIEPLKNEMSDTAYSTVWEMADKSTINAVGFQAVLGGVNAGKGNDSGAQIRTMADYQSNYRTAVVRNKILKPVLYNLREMGYTDVVPVFRGIELTTLDKNPNGKEAVIQHG